MTWKNGQTFGICLVSFFMPSTENNRLIRQRRGLKKKIWKLLGPTLNLNEFKTNLYSDDCENSSQARLSIAWKIRYTPIVILFRNFLTTIWCSEEFVTTAICNERKIIISVKSMPSFLRFRYGCNLRNRVSSSILGIFRSNLWQDVKILRNFCLLLFCGQLKFAVQW